MRPFDYPESYWLAGLLEGEGCFLKGPPSKPNLPRISLNMTDEDVVSRVAGIFAVGYRKQRDTRKSTWKQRFGLDLRGSGAMSIMALLQPLLGQRRRGQIAVALNSHVAGDFGIGKRKLSSEEIALAKALRNAGATYSSLAIQFNLGESAIWNIVNGRRPTYEKPKIPTVVNEGKRARLLKSLQIHWLAGLLEGEGTFLCGPPSEPNCPSIGLQMTDKDVVAAVAQIFETTYFRWINKKKPHYKPVFCVRLRGSSAVLLMRKLRPLMGKRRQKQIDKALSTFTLIDPLAGKRRLSAVQVARMCRLRSGGATYRVLGAKFGITNSNAWMIINGKRATY